MQLVVRRKERQIHVLYHLVTLSIAVFRAFLETILGVVKNGRKTLLTFATNRFAVSNLNSIQPSSQLSIQNPGLSNPRLRCTQPVLSAALGTQRV